jgi:hypothetical protein
MAYVDERQDVQSNLQTIIVYCAREENFDFTSAKFGRIVGVQVIGDMKRDGVPRLIARIFSNFIAVDNLPRSTSYGTGDD